jgi:(2R)-ethylmalonyl-CoA mutase
MELVPQVVAGLREAGLEDVPVVVGGIVPDADAKSLRTAGVAAIYTPKDYDLTGMMADVVQVIRHANKL